jgi:hypothetical protein
MSRLSVTSRPIDNGADRISVRYTDEGFEHEIEIFGEGVDLDAAIRNLMAKLATMRSDIVGRLEAVGVRVTFESDTKKEVLS